MVVEYFYKNGRKRKEAVDKSVICKTSMFFKDGKCETINKITVKEVLDKIKDMPDCTLCLIIS